MHATQKDQYMFTGRYIYIYIYIPVSGYPPSPLQASGSPEVNIICEKVKLSTLKLAANYRELTIDVWEQLFFRPQIACTHGKQLLACSYISLTG